MSWRSYIFPQTIFRTSSRYNRDIRINEERGKLKLLVNGARQSGEYIRDLWDAAFTAFHIDEKRKVSNVLILGVAGGTVIHLIHGLYPKAHITGVDIDPVMIDIGKRFFGLGSIVPLRVVQEDAKQFVCRVTSRFDLIVIDLFFGRNIPEFIGDPSFLRNARRILRKDGIVVINFLRELEYGRTSDVLMETLKKIFSTVQDFGIYHNRFFSAR